MSSIQSCRMVSQTSEEKAEMYQATVRRLTCVLTDDSVSASSKRSTTIAYLLAERISYSLRCRRACWAPRCSSIQTRMSGGKSIAVAKLSPDSDKVELASKATSLIWWRRRRWNVERSVCWLTLYITEPVRHVKSEVHIQQLWTNPCRLYRRPPCCRRTSVLLLLPVCRRVVITVHVDWFLSRTRHVYL